MTIYRFDRYINGQLMAEGVTIEKAKTLDAATAAAARIASKGPNGEAPVLVLRREPAAIEAPAQKPVAWRWRICYREEWCWSIIKPMFSTHDLEQGTVFDVQPLYTTPADAEAHLTALLRAEYERGRVKGWEEAADFAENFKPADFGNGEPVEVEPEVMMKCLVAGIRTLAGKLSALLTQEMAMRTSHSDARIPDHAAWAARGRWREAYETLLTQEGLT